MFTGLVETTGIVRVAEGESPRRLTIESDWVTSDIEIGASIAVDGCCLTVVARGSRELTFEAATETLALTTVGRLRVSDVVNLEQALKLTSRLGGHLVQGHIDGVGRVVSAEQKESALYVTVEVPPALSRYIAARGSIAVSGVSLTVTHVDDHRFSVGLIPHTLKETSPRAWMVGSEVNIEVDVIARYLERMLRPIRPSASATVDDGD